MKSLHKISPSRYLTNFFYLVGLWPSENSTIFYTIYNILFQSIFGLIYTTFKCIYFFKTDNMQDRVFCAFVSLAEIGLFVKIVNLALRNETVQANLNKIHDFKLESIDEKNFFMSRMKIFRIMLIAYISLTSLTGVFSYLVPFFADEPILPYLAWYPLDWYHNKTHYWIVYFYQVIGMIIATNMFVFLEMYTVYLFLALSTQIDILNNRLKKIGWNGDGDGFENRNDVLISRRKEAIATLVDCIKVHRNIFR